MYKQQSTLSILIIISLFIFYIQSAVSEIYRYQDKNGRWHFTDDKKPLKHDITIEAVDIRVNVSGAVKSRNTSAVALPKNLCLADNIPMAIPRGGHWGKQGGFFVNTDKGKDSSVNIYVANHYFSPVTFQFWFEESRNMHSSKLLPLSQEIQPHSNYKLLEIKPKNPELYWKYHYNYDYQIGKLNPSPSVNCQYLPPVPSGALFRVSQAFNGKFSHTGRYSKYAVDIAMPIGTDVLAARSGIIIERKSDFVLNGIKEKHKRRANVIRILHGDGTIATYAHLEFRTMKLKEGERVQTGQIIGRSGNTGYSTGPHLHFAIHANMNMNLTSVPFQFRNDSITVTPKKGMMLFNQPIITEESQQQL